MFIDKTFSYLSKFKSNHTLVKCIAVGSALTAATYAIYWYTRDSESPSEVPKKVVDEDPELTASLKLKEKGNKYFKGRKYQEGVKCYEEALAICPEKHKRQRAIFYQNMAACKENLDLIDDAIKDCNLAIELDKSYIKAFSRRCALYEKIGKFSDAFSDSTYITFLESYSDFNSMLRMDRLMKKLTEQLVETEETELCRELPIMSTIKNYYENFAWDPIYSCPIAHLSDNEHQFDLKSELQSIFTPSGDALASNTDQSLINFFGQLEKSITQFQDKQFKTSWDTLIEAFSKFEAYDKMVSLCNGNQIQLVYLLLAHLHMYSYHVIIGDNVKGAEDFKQISTLIQDKSVMDHKLTPVILANAYIKKGNASISYEQDLSGCMASFKKAQEICPDCPDIFLHRAQIHIRGEGFDEAIKDLNEAAKRIPDFSIVQALKIFTQHRTNMAKGDISGKEIYLGKFDKLIQKYPNCFESLSLYSNVLIDYGEFSKAEEICEKIHQQFPDSPMAHFNRGILYLHWKQDKDAIRKWMEKAISVDPKCDSAYEILGQLAMEEGEFESALKYFLTAIPFARNKNDLTKLIGFRESAKAQNRMCQQYGISAIAIRDSIRSMQEKYRSSLMS